MLCCLLDREVKDSSSGSCGHRHLHKILQEFSASYLHEQAAEISHLDDWWLEYVGKD